MDRYLRGVKRRLKQTRLVQAAVPPRSPRKRIPYEDLDAFLAEIKRKLETADAQQQLVGLSEIYFNFDNSEFENLDPFGEAYREKVMQFYKSVTGHSHYDAMVMERTDAADILQDNFTPIPYRFQNSELVGEHLSCYGWLLHNLDVRAGADVLEYGSGEGQLSIQLARMGCNVHAMDVEERFLNLIQKQSQALGIQITTKQGRFGEGFDGKQFDRVIFYEAFHHCFDHYTALLQIRELLKPNGAICFTGEPILTPDSADRILVPYPWGLRLDGEAMNSIAQFGWMELGYSEGYFLELLGRCGYSVERRLHPYYSRANTYIARKITSRYPIETNTVISTYSGDSGWHCGEGVRRWTDGDAWMPLPVLGFKKLTIIMENLAPRTLQVEVSTPSDAHHIRIASEKEGRVELKLSDPPGTLRIKSGTFKPPGDDPRILGIAVKSIEFT